jgi:hypothetical protein
MAEQLVLVTRSQNSSSFIMRLGALRSRLGAHGISNALAARHNGLDGGAFISILGVAALNALSVPLVDAHHPAQ